MCFLYYEIYLLLSSHYLLVSILELLVTSFVSLSSHHIFGRTPLFNLQSLLQLSDYSTLFINFSIVNLKLLSEIIIKLFHLTKLIQISGKLSDCTLEVSTFLRVNASLVLLKLNFLVVFITRNP